MAGAENTLMESERKGGARMHSAETYRVAGLLALVSTLILYEGTVRAEALFTTPDGMWSGNSTTFPPAAQLTGSVIEVLFALTGLTVGLAQLVFSVGSPLATMGTIGAQCLGWYTFVVYTIAAPAWSLRANMTQYPGLSHSQSDAIVSMGILGSVGVCFCLQGSQFFLAFKLLQLQKGNGALYSSEYHRSRLLIFSVAVLLTGASQVTAGAILRSAYGGGMLGAPVISPPFLVFFPAETITIGVLEVAYGLALVALGIRLVPSTRSVGLLYGVLGAFIFVCHHAFQNMGQDMAGAKLIVVTTQVTGLTFSLSFFPAYLAGMLCADGVDEMPDATDMTTV